MDSGARSKQPVNQRCHRIILAAGRDDPERAVRKRPLQRLGLVPRRAHPDVVFLGRRQDCEKASKIDPSTTR